MSDVIKNARSGALRRAMYIAGNSVAAENVQVGGGGVQPVYVDFLLKLLVVENCQERAGGSGGRISSNSW